MKNKMKGFDFLSNIIKFVIGILVFFFGFYMFLCEYDIRGFKNNLSKEEKRYVDILEMWFYISTIAIPTFMIAPFLE